MMEVQKANTIEEVYVELTRVVKLGGGNPFSTLHRTEGLYGWVTVDARGYMKDSLLNTYRQIG